MTQMCAGESGLGLGLAPAACHRLRDLISCMRIVRLGMVVRVSDTCCFDCFDSDIYGVRTHVLAWLTATDIDGHGIIIIIIIIIGMEVEIGHTPSNRQTDVVSGIQGVGRCLALWTCGRFKSTTDVEAARS